MKKIILCASLLCSNRMVNGQTITPTSTIIPGGGPQTVSKTPGDRPSNTPPENVINAFNADYPGNANVSWKADGSNYLVSYTDPKSNLNHIIVYDKEGKIVKRENEVDKLIYPSTISDYYIKQYPKETFKVWQTERTQGTYYYISRKGKVIWFDQKGSNIAEPEK